MIAPEQLRFSAVTPLPLLLYRAVLPALGAAAPHACKALFAANGWPGAWFNGIHGYHHFHATTPEVLGIVAGQVSVRFGGPAGETVAVRAGDVVVVPAGISHRNQGASADLLVVGAYPDGRVADLVTGTPHGTAILATIAAAAQPDSDPVFGADGPLTRLWRR